MHFSIPDTQELKDDNGSTYSAYNIHVNGSFHSSVRYRQLYNFHGQLRKAFGQSVQLPFFPPKRFLPLSAPQIEERRIHLEKYIQTISQDSRVSSSPLFTGFFLSAQHETHNVKVEDVDIEVFLMNWQSVKVNILTTDHTGQILEAVAKSLNLSFSKIPYFCLYMVNRNGNNCVLVRKLQSFESPYLSLKTMNSNYNSYRLVIRTNYWDMSFEEELLGEPIAVKLLCVQAADDVERGYLQTNKEIRRQLAVLHENALYKEYLDVIRNLKYYGYLHLEPCFCDYPQENTRVRISAGGKELNMRAQITSEQIKEFSFRVTRIRCWRLTTSMGDRNGITPGKIISTTNLKYELSFEYLMNKDSLQWITITSNQAILISMCLQGMVEEMLMKRDGNKYGRDQAQLKEYERRGSWSYMKKDGSSQQIATAMSRSISSDAFLNGDIGAGKQTKKTMKTSQSHNGIAKVRSFVENDAFDGIGDDDL